MAAEAQPGETFAERLDFLFRNVRRAEHNQRAGARSGPASKRSHYSVREVAAALGWSHTHLNNLRTGAANDPRWSEMNALARFFGVPVSYFAQVPGDEAAEEATSAEHELLRLALRRPGIELVALRMAEADLSPAGAAAVASMVEQVALLEEAARRARDNDGSGGGGVAAQR